jgi:4-nitrophenyl phosphatase
LQQGLQLPRERIFLAGAEAVRIAAGHPDAGVLMVAAPRMRRYASERGIALVDQNPNLVVLMRDESFDYAQLGRVANAVRSGAKMIVANADLTHPGAGGRVVPETGALLAAVLACTGEAPVDRLLIGKPGPLLFESACAVLGVSPDETLMIGDNPATDGEGAFNAGIRPILIGVASQLRLEHLVEAPGC